MRRSFFAVTVMCASSGISVAQEAHTAHGGAAVPATKAVSAAVVAKLPDICLDADASPAAPTAMNHEMNAAQADLMAGMDENNGLMMSAGMLEDLDVAFVCAMIPHHQSAINMAKAELEHGDNAWAKEMAQKIIDAQESEIAEMLSWLSGEGPSE